MQPRSGESTKMEARRIFVAATGGSSDATRGRRHEAAGEKVAEQFPGAVATRQPQHYIYQLQGISSNYLLCQSLRKYVNNVCVHFIIYFMYICIFDSSNVFRITVLYLIINRILF